MMLSRPMNGSTCIVAPKRAGAVIRIPDCDVGVACVPARRPVRFGEEDVARAPDTCGVRYDVTRRGDPEFGTILDGIEKCGLFGWADSVEVSARSLQVTAFRAAGKWMAAVMPSSFASG